MKTIKRRIFYFFRKHYKVYTWLVLIIGIALGCSYDGRGELGEYIFSFGKYTVYIGGFSENGNLENN